MFFYDKGQMYLPQYEKTFGSAFLTLDIPNHGFNIQDTNNSYYYGQNYLLVRTHWKALDNEEQRCDQKSNAGSTTRAPIHKKIKCNKKCNKNCNEMEFDSETYPNYSISPFHYIIFGPCESGMES